MLFSSGTKTQDYPDDIFAETRMSFGDHIEELRKHLLRAIYGLLIVLFGGFILDTIGEQLGNPNIGVGRPMLRVIVDPVESQVRDFYAVRNEKALEKIREAEEDEATPEEIQAILAKLKENGGSTLSLTSEERRKLRAAPQEMPIRIPTEAFEKTYGLKPKDPNQKEIEVTIQVYPSRLNYLNNRGEALLENKQYLTTLSVQEAFVVYFKVSLLCGVVLASPWIAYQIWAFVAAGLYPHERAYVYRFLTPSIVLFLAGVFLCQFVVLPGAVNALIAFNNWIELDPDLRLNEWLGFALLLPVVFGISFQTPLVMFFLNRIGMFGWEDYWAKWRHATIILAFFAAVITPTPDAVTMMYLFVPMFGLYLLGVGVCKYFPPAHELEQDQEQEAQVAV
jgi:sec-independent protein translocase protein TatC